MKKCSKCGEVKRREGFHKRRSRKSGLASWCKTCVNEYDRAKYHEDPERAIKRVKDWRVRNPDNVLENNRKYRRAHPEREKERGRKYRETHGEQRRATHRKWCKANPDRVRENNLRWREANPERARECSRGAVRRYQAKYPERVRASELKWRKANPEKVHRQRLLRASREQNAPGTCTAEQLAEIIEKYDGKCYLCGKPFEAIDHVVPLSRGGSNWPENLRPVCKSCNSRKGTKLLSEMECAS